MENNIIIILLLVTVSFTLLIDLLLSYLFLFDKMENKIFKIIKTDNKTLKKKKNKNIEQIEILHLYLIICSFLTIISLLFVYSNKKKLLRLFERNINYLKSYLILYIIFILPFIIYNSNIKYNIFEFEKVNN